MRCPQCRRDLAFEAIVCKFCGWRATVSAPAPQVSPAVKLAKAPPMKPEIRAALDRVLAKSRVQPRREERKPRVMGTPALPEVTPGHGGVCTCELCWPKHMAKIGKREEKPA